jgi:hypothetical protein
VDSDQSLHIVLMEGGLRPSRSYNELIGESQHTLRLLRQLQGEVAMLKINIHSMEEERKEWSLRYAKRLCIASNTVLAIWVFAHTFIASIRRRSRHSDWVAAKIIQATGHNNLVINATYAGIKAAIAFICSLVLLGKHRKEEIYRIAGFAISTAYSIYLAFGPKFLPRTNYLNVFFNLVYFLTRYYHSQGLPAFKQLQFL